MKDYKYLIGIAEDLKEDITDLMYDAIEDREWEGLLWKLVHKMKIKDIIEIVGNKDNEKEYDELPGDEELEHWL